MKSIVLMESGAGCQALLLTSKFYRVDKMERRLHISIQKSFLKSKRKLHIGVPAQPVVSARDRVKVQRGIIPSGP